MLEIMRGFQDLHVHRDYGVVGGIVFFFGGSTV